MLDHFPDPRLLLVFEEGSALTGFGQPLGYLDLWGVSTSASADLWGISTSRVFRVVDPLAAADHNRPLGYLAPAPKPE